MAEILRQLLLIGHPNIPAERLIAYEEKDVGIPIVLYLHPSALLDPRLENPWTSIRKDGRDYVLHPEAIRNHSPRQPAFCCIYRIARRYGEFIVIEIVKPMKERDLVNQLVEEARAGPKVFY